MLRAVLVFLVIVLLGANLALYRYCRAVTPTTAAATPAPPVASVAAAAPSSIAASSAPEKAKPTNVPIAVTPTTTASFVADDNVALLIPVQGVAAVQLQDTFSQARAQGRVHEAIDIMAPRGTPVIAVADGTVEKLFTSVPGGLTIYQFEPGGRYAYYYAHLDRYADGLSEKTRIRRGEVIGYVGSTGNADPSAPHLHFAIFELGPEKQWWKGTAINPYPVLRGDQ